MRAAAFRAPVVRFPGFYQRAAFIPRIGPTKRIVVAGRSCYGRLLNRMPRNYLAELERRVLIFDGSTGATLQTLELTADDFGGPRFEGCMDALCLTRPDAPARLHRGFLQAGCEVVEPNTFQASRLRLKEWGLADSTYAINKAGAEIARRECDSF